MVVATQLLRRKRGPVATKGFGQALIERYAKTRRERLFHSNGNEFVILQDSARGHFPVYMRARDSSPDVVSLRARWSAGFAHAERIRVHELVNRFNDRNKWLTASIRETHDRSALRVVGNFRFWVRDEVDFAAFVRFVDLSLAAATKLFEAVYAEATLSSPAELERCFQLSG